MGKAEGKGIWGKHVWEGEGIFSGCFLILLHLQKLPFKASVRSSFIYRYNLSPAQNFVLQLLQHLLQNCSEIFVHCVTVNNQIQIAYRSRGCPIHW